MRVWKLTAKQEDALPLGSEHDFVHNAVANIAILKAATMRTLWSCSDAPNLLSSIRFLQEQLRDWYGRLPQEAQLIQLGTDVHVPLKTSIYYLHLLHLGAVMLMFRHCLAGVQSAEDRKKLSDEQRLLMDKTLHDGLIAAQHSARMIHIIRQTAQNVRHCWITMCVTRTSPCHILCISQSLTFSGRFQTYVSGMILLYNAVQLSLAGLQGGDCATSLDLASKNIDVLDFCGQLDPVARKFSRSLSTHYERFREVHPAGDGDTVPQAHFARQQPSDYLLTAAPDNAELHDTAHKLFEQLCNPHANESTSTKQHEHDARSRSRQTHMSESHQTSPDGQKNVLLSEDDARTTLTPFISNLEDGYFIGSNEPNWWSAERSAVAYSSGAKTLEIL